MKRRRFDKPRIAIGAHHAGKLSGNHAAGIMNQLLRQYGSGWQVISRRCDGACYGGDTGPVERSRDVRIKSRRQITAACEHNVMAGRMIVGGV